MKTIKSIIYLIATAVIVGACNQNPNQDQEGIDGATGTPSATGNPNNCPQKCGQLEDALEDLLLNELHFVDEAADRHPLRKRETPPTQQTSDNSTFNLISSAVAAPLADICVLGSQYSATSYKFKINPNTGGKPKIEVWKRNPVEIKCEYTIPDFPDRIQIKILPAAGMLPDRFVIQNPVSLATPESRDIAKYGTNDIYVHIVKNTHSPTGFKIIGSDDDRNFIGSEPNADFTFSTLLNTTVNLSFKTAAAGSPHRIMIEGENTPTNVDSDQPKATIKPDNQ